MVFANKKDIGIMAGISEEYLLESWWQTSAGVKTVISEVVGLIWVACCFHPGEYQSHEEQWGIIKRKLPLRTMGNFLITSKIVLN